MSNSLEMVSPTERQQRFIDLTGEDLSQDNTALIKIENEIDSVDSIIDGLNENYLIDLPRTDTGNAECFMVKYGENYRYNKTNHKWYFWNGIIWKEDLKEEVHNNILDTIRHRQQAIADSVDNRDIEERQKAYKYFVGCENINKLDNARKCAERLTELITTFAQYDQNVDLIATSNGTINLRNREFYQSRREDYLTLQMGAEFDSEAECPRWKQFLEEVFNKDRELIDFIQKIVGYSLTGDTKEQLMFIFYGYGNNGKGVFIRAIQALLGDYAATATFTTFDADKKSEMSNDLAALKGKRFVAMSESGAERRLNEPLLKQVTGCDRISCRFLRQEFFEYVPQFKLFLATNHKPIITQSDFGIWRRITLIPFTENFAGREDQKLDGKLLAELPGILNWAIEGLKKWQNEGLKPFPALVQEATNEYKTDSDTIGQWFEKRMTIHPESKIKSSDAHQDYSEWCKENGSFPVGNRVFKASLDERGYKIKKGADANYWLGFGFPFNLR